MSGHSHAKTVKRVKDANDAKRGKVFSKIARMISVAAREGGDPSANSKLRAALDEAKKANLPKDNVERAIKRGTGEEQGEQLEEVLYEVIGPNGVMLILEGITDNKNRTLAEIRQVLQKHNTKLADEGSLRWQFEQKGFITAKPADQQKQSKEKLELKAIEAGAEETRWFKEEAEEGREKMLAVQTSLENLEAVKAGLEQEGVKLESSTLGWQAKQEIEVSPEQREKLNKLFDELDDNEAVQEIYSNLKVWVKNDQFSSTNFQWIFNNQWQNFQTV